MVVPTLEKVFHFFSADGIPGVLGSIVSSFTFKQYVVNPTHKLLVFASFNLARNPIFI